MSDAPKKTPLIIGAALLIVGAGLALAIRCPEGALPFVILVLLAAGISLLTFGFLQKSSMTVKWKTISASGPGALILIILFAKPDVVKKMMCQAPHRLYFRVIKGTDETAAIGGATVKVMGYVTTTLKTNSLGECNYPYADDAVGQEMRIWAEAQGYKNSQAQPCVLDQIDKMITIPMQPVGPTAEIILPTMSDTDYQKPVALSARNYETELNAAKSDELRSARIGEAAYANGDYKWAIKSLEQAKQNQKSGEWKASAPYLIAAYLKMGEAEKAKAEAESLKTDIKKRDGYLGRSPPLSFTARNAEAAADTLGEADKPLLRDVGKLADSYKRIPN